MYELAKPKLAIPVHGEFIHTKSHCNIAIESGVEKAIQIANGDAVKINNENIKESAVVGIVQTGYLGVDGTQLIDFKSTIIKERRKLQESGIVTISLALNQALELVSKPKILAIGSYDLEKDYSAKNMIEDEIRISLKQFAKKTKLTSTNSGFSFLKSKKKENNARKIFENSIAKDVEKTLRGQVIKIFTDLMGKRPAVEIIIHII